MRDAQVPKPTLNWKDPRIIRTRMQDGKVMMPAAWRDVDDED